MTGHFFLDKTMKITVDQARRAGEMSKQFSWTDKELATVLHATELTVAFFEGKGEDWHLVLRPLWQELSQLRGFVQARKLDR